MKVNNPTLVAFTCPTEFSTTLAFVNRDYIDDAKRIAAEITEENNKSLDETGDLAVTDEHSAVIDRLNLLSDTTVVAELATATEIFL